MKRLLIITVITVLFIALVLFPGTRSIFLSFLNFNRIISPLPESLKNDVQAAIIKPTPDPLRPISILLMGYGGGKHDGGLLTDTIQIARIDPRLKEVILISVPRDLFVSLPTSVTATSGAKINAAFAFGSDDTAYPDKPKQFMGKNGGGAMAKYAVETVTGIPLDYYAAINFDSFTKTIDTLGGIDVNIRQTFTDPFYPLDGREKDTCGFSEDITKTIEATASGEKREQAYWCRFEPLTFTKGTVHLDGATALKYARSRHSPNNGGDFARSVRQKEVLEAVKTKMLSLGFLTKLIPFFQSISGNIQTDINAGTIQSALAIAGDIREYKINSIALTTDNVLKEDMTPEGQYILAPTDGIFNYKNIQKFITISIASISATSQTNK